MDKNLELAVYYNFGAFGTVYYNFGAFRRFLLLVLAPKALFIVSFGAEGVFYYQFWRLSALFIVKDAL